MRHRARLFFCFSLFMLLLMGCQQDYQSQSALDSGARESVGYVEGDFKVSNNGAATYEIKLESPIGTAGMQPDLSLVYNNQGGNGLLGMGWSLSGLSAISRCPKTVAQDGVKEGVNFTSGDRFCVDGMRLVAVKGAYGADGTEYRTEREQWSRYYSLGSCGSGPCAFSVRGKDGSLTEYGQTDDSRILATGREEVRIWAVHSREDRNGNYITVSYANDTQSGEYYPSAVDYTGNRHTGMKPGRRIAFSYDTERPDPSVSFIAGSQVLSRSRITQITTSVGGEMVKTYHIGYQTSDLTGQSLISQISECGIDGSCFSPTTFSWGNVYTSNHTFAHQQWGRGGAYYQSSSKSLGDFNANSTTDLGYIYNDSGRVAIDVYLSDGATFRKENWYSGSKPWEDGEFVSGDYTGDGVSDIAYVYNDSGYITIDSFVSNRNSFNQSTWYKSRDSYDAGSRVSTGDLNGDGIADIVYAFDDAGQVGINVYLSSGSSFSKSAGLSTSSGSWSASGSLNSGDFNHDGLTDLAYVYNDSGDVGINLYISTGTEMQQSTQRISGLTWSDDALISFSDYNGDGKTDIAYFFDNSGKISAQVLLASGSTFTSSRWLNSDVVWGGAKVVKSSDYNGDSLTDVAYVYEDGDNKANIYTFLSDGKSFTLLSKIISAGEWGDEQFIPSNFKANGLSDIVNTYNDSGNLGFSMYVSKDSGGPSFSLKQSDLLNVIVTGMNETITIGYTPLTDTSVYGKTGKALFPAAEVQIPYYVVARHTVYEPISETTSQTDYTFKDAQVNLHGRGWQGFSTMTARNVSDKKPSMQTDTVNVFHQDFPLTGLKKEQTIRRVSDGAVLWKTTFDYGDAKSLLSPDVYIVYKNEKETLGYSNGTHNYTLSERYFYTSDHKVIVRTDYVNSDGPSHSSCSQYLTPDGDENWWHAFFKNAEKVVSSTQACKNPDFTKWSPTTDLRFFRYDFDLATLNPTQVSQWNNQLNAFSTTSMHYDAYGNVLTQTDPAGNTSTIIYDDRYQTFPISRSTPAPTQGEEPFTIKTLYDPKFNVLVKQIDANDNTVMEVPPDGLDGFGRILKQNTIQPKNTELVTTSVRSFTVGKKAGVDITEKMRDRWSDEDQNNWFWETKHYDALGRVYQHESKGLAFGENIVQQTHYNDQGLKSAESLPFFSGEEGHFTQYSYDIKKRVIDTAYPIGALNSVAYQDDDNRIQSHIAPSPSGEGAVKTVITVDNYGQKVQSVAPNGGVSTYRYDLLGQKVEETDPLGMKTTYTYTSLGLISSISDAERGKTLYTYNSSGKPVTIENGMGEKNQFTYDALWRIIKTEYFDDKGTLTRTVTQQYDTAPNGKGLLASVTTPDAKYRFAYDYNGRLAAKTVALPIEGIDREFTTTFTYDPLGRRTGLGLPDGSQVDYKLFATGSTHSLTYTDVQGHADEMVRYERYGAMAGLEMASFQNGVVANMEYDLFGRMTTERLQFEEGTLRDFAYDWNLANKITSITDRRTVPDRRLSQSLTYNSMGFLIHSSGVYGEIHYDYNITGDITVQNDVRYSYDPVKKHQMTSGCATQDGHCDDLFAFSYDGIGNLIAKTDHSSGTETQWEYHYDAADNLQEIVKGTSRVATYVYGSDWQRIKKTGSDGSRTYYLSPEYVITVDTSGVQSVEKYLSSEHGTVALVRQDEITYFHLNNIGSSTILTRSSGAQTDQLNYRPFGAIDYENSEIETDFIPKFTSKELDSESGLYYLGARYYDSTLNRFISPDPARQFASPYVYGNNDPIINTDPSGQFFGIDDAIEFAVAAEIATDVATEAAVAGSTVAVAAGEATGAIGLAVETEGEVSAITTAASMQATGVGVEATQAEVTSSAFADSIVSGSERGEVNTGIDIATQNEIDQSETAVQSFSESNMEDDAPSSFENDEDLKRGKAIKSKSGGSSQTYQIKRRAHNNLRNHTFNQHRVITSSGSVDSRGVRRALLYTNRGDDVLILSGTHGNVYGETAAERGSLEVLRFAQQDISTVRSLQRPGRILVSDLGSARQNVQTWEIDRAMNTGYFRGRQYNCVIGGFCYSEVRYNQAQGYARERLGGNRLLNNQ